jgi:hypothetical protein
MIMKTFQGGDVVFFLGGRGLFTEEPDEYNSKYVRFRLFTVVKM